MNEATATATVAPVRSLRNVASQTTTVRPTLTAVASTRIRSPARAAPKSWTSRSSVSGMRGLMALPATAPVATSAQVASTDVRTVAVPGTHISGTTSAQPRTRSVSTVERKPSSAITLSFSLMAVMTQKYLTYPASKARPGGMGSRIRSNSLLAKREPIGRKGR